MIQMHPAITSAIAKQRQQELLSQAQAFRQARTARAARTEIAPEADRSQSRLRSYRAGLARLVVARAR